MNWEIRQQVHYKGGKLSKLFTISLINFELEEAEVNEGFSLFIRIANVPGQDVVGKCMQQPCLLADVAQLVGSRKIRLGLLFCSTCVGGPRIQPLLLSICSPWIIHPPSLEFLPVLKGAYCREE